MSTLFASDLHISEQRRLPDTEAALDFLVNTIIQKQPEYLVLLGDIFDKRKPTPLELQVFNKFLYRVRGHSEIIVLEGNHDIDRDISTLSYLQDLTVPGVNVVRPPYVFGSFYLGHEHINGAQVGDGFTLSGGKSLDDIIAKYPLCKVFAFGDFHKPQVLREAPFCFYAGSLIKTTFAEKNDKKFLWLFDDTVLIDKIEVVGRNMIQYDVMILENEDRKPLWGTPEAKELLNGALVKIVYSGTKGALAQVEEDSVKRYLIDNLHVQELRIEYRITDNSKPRNEHINESVSNNNALKEFFNDKDTEYKEEIIKAGEELLNE